MSDLKNNQPPFNPVIYYSIQLLALALLLVWCFKILEPFITLLVWGSVLAITLFPLHKMLTRKLKGRNALSSTLITLVMLLVIIGPAVWLLVRTFDELREVGAAYRAGELTVPPPTENVKGWPVIGSTLYNYWYEASKNLTALIAGHREEVKSLLIRLFTLLKTTASGVLLFTLSIIVSGVLLAYAKPASVSVKALLVKIAGQRGESMTEAAELTVRNVAKGVLGVAVIQSLLAGVGFVSASIPLAGLWIIICLILAIVQIGILPVSVGVIIYIWGAADTMTATILTIWMVFVGLIDNVLKPIMLGKGAPAPMLIVFLGAIGGFILSGFIGLFTGAIVLTLGYKLVSEWLNPSSVNSEKPEETKKLVSTHPQA
jgi:predicted PurR-regulated permease PerM